MSLDLRSDTQAGGPWGFLGGGGEMGALMRALDWTATPLGPPAHWPQSLRTVLGIMLHSHHPMFVAWGPQLSFLYNDAYAPILGTKHPAALGQPFAQIWSEIWADVSPLVERALAGEATWSEDLPLIIERHGYPEDTWYTFSYSPILDDGGGAGMFCACTETTAKVLAERRLKFQLELSERLRDLRDPLEVSVAAAELLGVRLGASRVGYGDVDADEVLCVPRDWAAAGEPPGAPGTLRPLAGFGPKVLEVLRRGAAVALDDVANDPRCTEHAGAYGAVSARALIIVPLLKEGRLMAVFYVNQSSPRAWSPAEITLAEDVAERTWEAIERARAELALGRQHAAEGERLRKLFSQAPGFMSVLRGPDHIIEFVNDAYARLVGDRPLVGLSVRESLPEVEGQGFFELLDEVYATGQPYFSHEAPLTLQRAPGAPLEERLVDFIYQPVTGADGAVTGIFVEGYDVTDRRLAADALRESEARLRLAMHAGRMGDMTFDIQSDEVRHSPSYAALLGFPADQVLTLAQVRSRYHPDDIERTMAQRAATLSGAQSFYDVEHRVIWPDGAVRWIYGRGEVARDAAGEAVAVTAVYIDVTEQKRVEAALRESEDHYRHAVELNPQVAWTALPSGQLDRVAERWMEWTGNGGLGSSWGESIHPDDLEPSVIAWTHSVQTGEPYDIEHRVRLRSGEHQWIWSRAFPRRDETGAIVKWYGATENIHERKLVEARLRESEAQFRTFAQAMPNHVWTAPADGRLDWFNDKVYEYTGAAPGELDGDGWAAVAHPDDLPGAAAAWAQSIETGRIYDVEFRIRRQDGAYRWHLTRALPIHDPGGLPIRWIGTNTDIEDQKAGAEALSRLNATLESRVEERSRELRAAEEALRQAHKMEAVGQLTGGIAHDFNNLLTGIIGSLDIVRRRIAGGRLSDVDRFIDAAVTSANRAAGLTHRLLAFSRRQSLDSQPIPVDRLVASMEDLLRRTLSENVSLELHSEQGLWTAEADANQLESALLNLAINARDAMPGGGVLRVETANAQVDAAGADGLEPGDYVVMCVTDTGMGMTQEVLERAFDPFFTTKPIGQGTGLGLSMIYGFAKQSRGHVRITSQVGEGTAVKLYLPRFHGDAPPNETAAQTEAPRARAGETVLVVEDDAAVRMLVVDVLQELGYGFVEAVDGKSAAPILQSAQRIDLLISDVGLPGMNGRQLADIARQARPSLKVLFITGYAENAAVRGGFLEPGMEMITKPFALDALAAKIREMLKPEA